MSTPRKELLMSTPLIHRPESNGASTPAVTAAAPGLTEYAFPATSRDIGAQASAVLGLLTGVWVALSPWFLTLQNTGTNANTVNLISGLAVAGVGALALLSPRGFAGPILSQKFSIADPMFWSNSVAGGVLIAVAALGLTAVAMRRPARR